MKQTSDNFEIESLINEVLDNDSFVKTLALVKGKSSLGEAAGEGVVSGFGSLSDIRVGVFGTMHEVLKGAIGKKSAKKISQIVGNAVKVSAPVIGFIDSEGARFAEGIKALEGYAGITQSFAHAYGHVPVILVVKGACYGSLSYLTSFCDLCIALPDAKIATSSPLILAANAGVDLSAVASQKIHVEKTGIITNTVKNTAELKKLLSDVLGMFASPDITSTDDANRVSKSLKNGVKMTTVIKEVVDNGHFISVREGFGSGIITGLARLDGMAVGIVATNGEVSEGKITADGAFKATAFITMCDNFDIPIVNLVDCGGVINDLKDENGSLIRNISDMLYAFHAAADGKVALISGKAIGMGYSAFASKHIVDYTIAWDGGTIGMLGDVQTATLLYSDQIAQSANKDELTHELAKSYGKENSSACVVAESGYIDNVINPAHTRQYLISAVSTFALKK